MKKFIFTLLLCLLPFTANAKILFGGHPLLDIHISTLKGHFYHAVQIANDGDVEKDIASTAAWMMEKHKSGKDHEVSEDPSKESLLIQGAVFFMREVEKGVVPGVEPEMIEKWYFLGLRVVSAKERGQWILKLKK